MATKLCDQCRREHPGKECDYDPQTGQCSETVESVRTELVDKDGNVWTDGYFVRTELLDSDGNILRVGKMLRSEVKDGLLLCPDDVVRVCNFSGDLHPDLIERLGMTASIPFLTPF